MSTPAPFALALWATALFGSVAPVLGCGPGAAVATGTDADAATSSADAAPADAGGSATVDSRAPGSDASDAGADAVIGHDASASGHDGGTSLPPDASPDVSNGLDCSNCASGPYSECYGGSLPSGIGQLPCCVPTLCDQQYECLPVKSGSACCFGTDCASGTCHEGYCE